MTKSLLAVRDPCINICRPTAYIPTTQVCFSYGQLLFLLPFMPAICAVRLQRKEAIFTCAKPNLQRCRYCSSVLVVSLLIHSLICRYTNNTIANFFHKPYNRAFLHIFKGSDRCSRQLELKVLILFALFKRRKFTFLLRNSTFSEYPLQLYMASFVGTPTFKLSYHVSIVIRQ